MRTLQFKLQAKQPRNDVRRIFDAIVSPRLMVYCYDDWYDIRVNDVLSASKVCLNSYNSSLSHALADLYREYDWVTSRFRWVPHHYWNLDSNHKDLLEKTAKKIGVFVLDDWYEISFDDMADAGCRTTLLKHDGSLVNCLQNLYPDKKWDKQQFINVPHNHWDCLDNQREKFDDIGRTLKLKTMDSWYSVQSKAMVQEKGSGILANRYKGRLIDCLESIYKDYNWDHKQFLNRSGFRQAAGFWHKQENVMNFLKRLEVQQNIEKPESWYRVCTKSLRNTGGSFIAINLFPQILSKLHPKINWEWSRFSNVTSVREKRSKQRLLVNSTRTLLV